jgi:hypothetical protein
VCIIIFIKISSGKPGTGGLGGRDQEDRGLKPAQANSSQDPISKKPTTKKGLVEWLKMWTLSSSPRTRKKITSGRHELEMIHF